MATLRDYFLVDKNQELKVTQSNEITARGNFKIPVQMFLDFSSGAIYLAFYLAPVSDPLQRSLDLITGNAVSSVLGVSGGFEIAGGFPDTNPIKASSLKFCGRIYLYSDNVLSEQDLGTLFGVAKERDFLLEYYGPTWAAQRSQLERPLAFISHDGRDKESIAKPLVAELLKFPGCTVWYDEYSLNLGDHLRESIEKGLKECSKCVLLLTKNFLTNRGWTKEEFNAVFTRELVEKANVVLPVWCGVSREEVYEYSPGLANRFAAQWTTGAATVARQIYLASNA